MRRFWKSKDEVKPFRPPSDPKSPPGAAAASASHAGHYLGDTSHPAAAPARGSGWIGREIDGRCVFQQRAVARRFSRRRSPNISRPLGAIVRAAAAGAPTPIFILARVRLCIVAHPPPVFHSAADAAGGVPLFTGAGACMCI
jgi:hypothetical protein